MSDEVNGLNGVDDIPCGDSGIMRESVDPPGLFQVYSVGEVTVVGFGGRDVPSDFWIGRYKNELAKIVREQNCRELAFDLSGVVTVPSGMLGLMSSLSDLGVTISIFNPSDDVREILRMTKLNERLEIREVDLDE